MALLLPLEQALEQRFRQCNIPFGRRMSREEKESMLKFPASKGNSKAIRPPVPSYDIEPLWSRDLSCGPKVLSAVYEARFYAPREHTATIEFIQSSSYMALINADLRNREDFDFEHNPFSENGLSLMISVSRSGNSAPNEISTEIVYGDDGTTGLSYPMTTYHADFFAKVAAKFSDIGIQNPEKKLRDIIALNDETATLEQAADAIIGLYTS